MSENIQTKETKTNKINFVKGTKIYFISRDCIGCHVCLTFCPAEAIRYEDCRNEIIQSKCTHCGTCYRECPISVITETEV